MRDFDDFDIKMDRDIINLTNFLKKEDVQKTLNDNINFPKLSYQKIVLERDSRIIGNEYLIGMSYDYAIRFLYSYKINNNIDDPLYSSIGYRLESNKKNLMTTFKIEQESNKLLALVNLSFKLSLNEILYRSGERVLYSSFKKDKINAINEEIIKLLKLSFPMIGKEDKLKIDFNPDFSYEHIIADGDILINDTLVDFKAVSSLFNFKDHIKQLLMYSILNELNGNKNIKNIQLYYPRFDFYPKYNIKDLIVNKKKIIDLI